MQTYIYRRSAVTPGCSQVFHVMTRFYNSLIALISAIHTPQWPATKHLLALGYGYISITPTESIAEVTLFFPRTQISKTFMR